MHSRLVELRSSCRGVLPLDGRLEPWMESLLIAPEPLFTAVRKFGSPVNVHQPALLRRNATDLQAVADATELSFEAYFARKANKCLAYIAASTEAGIGVDTASLQELQQCLDAAIDPKRIVFTAAIKSPAAMRLAVESGAGVVIDNFDELALWAEQVRARPRSGQATPWLLRLRGFKFGEQRHRSRFGVDVESVPAWLDEATQRFPELITQGHLVGLHFHLDGYDAQQRIVALRETITLADALRPLGFEVGCIDIGGGFPICYLESAEQWQAFQRGVRKQQFPDHPEVTFRRDGLGATGTGDALDGAIATYPYWQSPVFTDWLREILLSEFEEQTTIATALRERELQLRCEPGRSLLDGCGLTAARVAFRKEDGEGNALIGLEMNSTQCRTTSRDFCVDPILLSRSSDPAGEPLEGYLVGAYCMESEVLTPRRLRFEHGVQVGDLLVFPNTAGYQMHFLESRSHLFPLAKNVIWNAEQSTFELDEIDRDEFSVSGW